MKKSKPVVNIFEYRPNNLKNVVIVKQTNGR